MNAFLKESVLKPLFRRLGTMGATALVLGGDFACDKFDLCGLVTQSGAELVATYVAAVGLLCFDVLMAHIHKQSVREKAAR